MENLARSFLGIFQGDSLKTRALQGTAWTIGGMAMSMLLRLASNLVLTRLLFPEAFGLMALVTIFLTGLAMFSDIGIHTSIIRSDRSNDHTFLNTAWTVQIIRGLMLWFLSCSVALPFSWIYEEPLLAALLPIAGLTAIIDGFNPTRVYTANRDLLLGRLTLIDIFSQTVGIAFMVILAWTAQSVWALVIGSLIGRAARQTLLWVLMPGRRDSLELEKETLLELIHFGKWIFLSSICGFLLHHADRAILGKFISLEMLGIYSVGFFLASVPLLLGRPIASKIVFPLYKKRPPWESIENRNKISKMRRLLTGALLCISAFLVLTGNWLVEFLYDSRYSSAGPILILLVISQLPIVILSSYDQILLAAGDSKRFMMRVAINSFVQIGLLIFGIMHLGLIGAVLAPGLTAIILYPILISAVRQYGGWDKTHDLIYGGTAIIIAVVGVWINYDTIVLLANKTMPG